MKSYHLCKTDYEEVKDRLSMRQVAEFYGYKVQRGNVCLCPFHNDTHPSMKIYPDDKGFYCWVCQKGGDVIKFVGLLYGLKNEEACKRLIDDFSLPICMDSLSYREKRERQKQQSKYREIEKFKKDGIDVLFLTKDIDEFAFTMMNEYEKVEFRNISAHDKESLSDDEKSKLEVLEAENKELLDNIKDSLGAKVDKVSLSTKLVDSPVCISTQNGLSLSMEQTINQVPGDEKAKASKVLEVNPNHELFKAISEFKGDKELIKKYSDVLYDEAMLLEGFEIEDKATFIKNLNELMLKSLKK